jgi:hypothetical protein
VRRAGSSADVQVRGRLGGGGGVLQILQQADPRCTACAPLTTFRSFLNLLGHHRLPG